MVISNELKEKVLQKQLFERSAQSQTADNNRQHKKQVDMGKKETSEDDVKEWLEDPTKSDIVGVDNIDKDRINKVKYGTLRTKQEKKLLNKIKKINAKRPEKELVKDLSSDEPLVELNEWKKWKKNKKKYDIKGIDTIPDSVVGEVSNEVRKKYIPAIKRQKYNRGMSITTMGTFSYGVTPKGRERNYIRVNRLIKGNNPQQSKTLTHEIGHAFDYNVLGKKETFASKKVNDVVRTQMKNVALKEKPIPKTATIWYAGYRKRREELFADAFVGFLRNPKQTKKENPNYSKWLTTSSRGFGSFVDRKRKQAIEKRVKVIKKRNIF